MTGALKPPVGSPPVAFQHAAVVLAEDLDRLLISAALGDQVHGHVLASERPQPRLLAADPPAGLIRRDRAA
jgi:hypothetical protein